MAVLYDQFGRPIQGRDLKGPERREIAVVTVQDRWSGYPSQGLTPVKLAAIFREADAGDVYRQAELFEEMEEKDAHLSAELLKRKNAVLSLDYDVQPYEDTHQGRRAAEFCRGVIGGLPHFEESLFDLLDAIGKGFACCEVLWEVSGGRVTVGGLNRVYQKRLTFVDALVPRIIAEDGSYEEIPPFKLLFHRHRARSGHDMRAGLLRVCAWMYLFKNYALKDWMAFCEIFGMPLRLGRYDPAASAEDKEALVSAVKALGTDAAGIISKNTEIEFVETVKNVRGSVHEVLAGFCNREISKAVVGGTLTSEVGERGSYAAAKTHNDVRLDLVRSDAWALANTIRMQLLRPLVGFNFGWDVPVPWFRFHLEEPEDLERLSRVYLTLRQMGQPISVEHVASRFGVPLPAEGETALAPPGGGTAGALKRMVAAKERPGFGQGQVDGLATDAAGAAGGLMEEMLAPVLERIEGAGSLGEIGEALYETYPELDPGLFQELLARAMFAAGLTGAAAVMGEE